MKLTFLLFLSLQLLLFSGRLAHGRKEPGDYWKSIMKDQPMPEAIKDFIQQDAASFSSKAGKMDHFVKDFDARPNSIIYHGHVEHRGGKPYGGEKKPELKKAKFSGQPRNWDLEDHKQGHHQKGHNS